MPLAFCATFFACVLENPSEIEEEQAEETQDSMENSDVSAGISFTSFSPAVTLLDSDLGAEIFAKAESDAGEVLYQWYESSDGTFENVRALEGENAQKLAVEAFDTAGLRFFYCTASAGGESAKSRMLAVYKSSLPCVSIETPDAAEITSKDDWMKGAKLSVTGAKEEKYNTKKPIKTRIRGRGNSTWVQSKKTYALKLNEAQEILGMPSHKRWVLIANYLDNSFMRNEMAFYLSKQFGLDWTVHGEFVDLVLNGEYKGLYWLGEAIKVDENRVNINDGSDGMGNDENKDYLIEMDVYYDEAVKFKSSIRNLPYMIKNDDYMVDKNDVVTVGGNSRLVRLQGKIDTLENLLYPDLKDGMNTKDCAAPDESYAKMLDIDSWVKFWFVNEIMDNCELGHPKSCYFTFDSTKNILKAGPVWDFDWASLGQRNATRLKNTIYYDALFKSPSFRQKVEELWNEKSSDIDLSGKIESLRAELEVAAKADSFLWGVHADLSGIIRKDFDAYVDFLKETLNKKFDVVGKDVENLKS